ncbi:MAG: putative endonuclease [Bermanella sp.]
MSEASSWWVYMIRARSGKLYTGISTDVQRRYREHSDGGAKGARFFRGDPPQTLVHTEAATDRSAASRREAAIKNLSRVDKLALIATSSSGN